MGMAFASRKLNILLSHAHLRTSPSKARQLLPVLSALSSAGLVNVMIDSGAFTAFSLGKPIPIEEYIDWCKNVYSKFVWQYVALDVVNDPQATQKNLDAMVAAGLKPMPVFVIGEKMSKVKELAEINEHICVAGGVNQPVSFMQERYSAVFKASEGRAKIHGLGFVKFPQMWEIPLFSVDCSSWMQGQRWGVATTYDPRRGLVNGFSLTKVLTKVKKILPEQASLLTKRGIRPETLSPSQFSGQYCYAAAETTTSYVRMMRDSWRMAEKDRASFFLAIAKSEDLAMIIASCLMISEHGDRWKYADWQREATTMSAMIREMKLEEVIQKMKAILLLEEAK